MSETNITNTEDSNTPKKRSYVSRKDEFVNTTVDQVKAVIAQISLRLRELKKDNRTPEENAEVKELVHKRVRAYQRLRNLGYNSKELRAKKTATVPATPTPPTV